MQYLAIPSVDPDQTSLTLYPCKGEPDSLVVWIHGGGWFNGDRRRTLNMPTFFGTNNILFISANYPLKAVPGTSLIDLQVMALDGLDQWLAQSELRIKYCQAFENITIISHSAGAHLVALKDKLMGWGKGIKCIFLMDCAAYDLQARWSRARAPQRRLFSSLLELDRRPANEYESVLRSYSPALLPPKPRSHVPLKVIIVTSTRPGAYYSAEQLARSYNMDGYEVETHYFELEHEEFPRGVGSDIRINKLLLH